MDGVISGRGGFKVGFYGITGTIYKNRMLPLLRSAVLGYQFVTPLLESLNSKDAKVNQNTITSSGNATSWQPFSRHLQETEREKLRAA